MAAAHLDALASEQFCYLTTRGRRTGFAREIEIWFGLDGRTLYMLSGGRDRSDWVRNILADPKVTVRIGDSEFQGGGRVVEAATAEDALAAACSWTGTPTRTRVTSVIGGGRRCPWR